MASRIILNYEQKKAFKTLLQKKVKEVEDKAAGLEQDIRDNFDGIVKLLNNGYDVKSIVESVNKDSTLRPLKISFRNFNDKFRIIEKEYMTNRRKEIITQQFDSITKLLIQKKTFKSISKRLNNFETDKSTKDNNGFSEKLLNDIYNDLKKERANNSTEKENQSDNKKDDPPSDVLVES